MIYLKKYDSVTHLFLSRQIFRKNLYGTSAYYIDGLLLDSGSYFTSPELLKYLKNKNLATLINTHSHEDHIGGNDVLQKHFPGLKIYSHPKAIEQLANPKQIKLHLYRKVLFGYPGSSQSLGLKNNAVIKTKNYIFQIIYTPGHSNDHLCIYEPEREWLFSGDLFIGGEDKATRLNYNMWEIINSLKLISKFSIKYLFPGSARVRKKPKQALLDKIDYLENLGNIILELHKKGYAKSEIIKELFPKPLAVELLTFGHFSRKRLIDSYLKQNDCG